MLYLFSSLLPPAQISVLFFFHVLSFAALSPPASSSSPQLSRSSFSVMHCSLVRTRPQSREFLCAFCCAGGGGRSKIVSKAPGLTLACD